jgi:hypothetical protein
MIVLRLVHRPLPVSFFLPWMLAGLLALIFAVASPFRNESLRVLAQFILIFALVLVTFFSDGTNLSLWVALAVFLGPPSSAIGRRLAALGCGVAHMVAQFTLLPLPPAQAPWAYLTIQATGVAGFVLWKAWGRRRHQTPS